MEEDIKNRSIYITYCNGDRVKKYLGEFLLFDKKGKLNKLRELKFTINNLGLPKSSDFEPKKIEMEEFDKEFSPSKIVNITLIVLNKPFLEEVILPGPITKLRIKDCDLNKLILPETLFSLELENVKNDELEMELPVGIKRVRCDNTITISNFDELKDVKRLEITDKDNNPVN